jgi:IS605 OrfB family transposase
LSCRFTTGVIRVEPDRQHVTLPVLGTIKTHESTRKLARRLDNGTAKLGSATVRYEAGRWFVSFTVQVQHAQPGQARPDAVLGVDLGVTALAVFSDGRGAVPNPKHLDASLDKLRRACRRVSRRHGPNRRTGARPSNRWRRANRVHHRVANLRRDAFHQLTTALAGEYGTVVVEDLNVAGMVRNRRLGQSISDAGFGEIRRQLTYKTSWAGGRLEVADRWCPSSKTCSSCGVVKPKLPLRKRTFTCEYCGLVLDRDENAALNLAALVTRHVDRSGGETQNGRGADPKTAPRAAGGYEASTPHRAPARIRQRPSPSNGAKH